MALLAGCSRHQEANQEPRRDTPDRAVQIRQASDTPRSIAQPPASRFNFSVRDASTHELIPCKLTFLGVKGSNDPAFSSTDLPKQLDGAIGAYNRVFSLKGAGSLRVPRGTYDVYVSRGLEWTLNVTRGFKIGAKGASLDVTLEHVVNTDGWISGDFHVHAAASWDSRVPMRARVYEFASDGVEVLVSTDHNVISDYAPYIEELGAGKYLTSVVGSEITTRHWGHFGAFPLTLNPSLPNGGPVRVKGRTPKQLFEAVRQRSPLTLIDIHHPRFGRIGYFDEGRLDAAHGRFKRAVGTSFNFDAIELFNGYRDSERHAIDDVLSDWFNLIDHGYHFAGTGNSDTHHLRFNIGGYPRNFVRVENDTPSAMTPALLTQTVKQGHSFFTTGPFVRIAVDGAGVGDTVSAPSGKVHGTIEIDAAPWISVANASLYVDGRVTQRWTVPASQNVVRMRTGFDLAVERDAYVVLRVEGDRPLTPVAGEPGGFRVFPMALTNPVYIDVDGDGRYDAPQAQAPRR